MFHLQRRHGWEGVFHYDGYTERVGGGGLTCGRTLTGVNKSCLAANNNVRNKGKNCNTSCKNGFMVSGPNAFMAENELDNVPTM